LITDTADCQVELGDRVLVDDLQQIRARCQRRNRNDQVLAAGIDFHVLQFKVRQGNPRLRAEVHPLDIQCFLI
jgi:hypothetical protein